MKLIIIAFSLLLLVSCTKNPDRLAVDYNWLITKVEGPTSGSVNQPISLQVYWPSSNGCDIVDRFEEKTEENTITIKAYGHTHLGVCTQDASIRKTTYNFSSAMAGTFELKFISKDNSIISRNMIIN